MGEKRLTWRRSQHDLVGWEMTVNSGLFSQLPVETNTWLISHCFKGSKTLFTNGEKNLTLCKAIWFEGLELLFWTNTNCISSTENRYYISQHLHFRSYHSNKMQQIHAWLVGFGVRQLQQRWNSKTSSISWISTLRRHAQGQNKNTRTTRDSFKQTTIQNPGAQSERRLWTQTQTTSVWVTVNRLKESKGK